MKKTYGFLILYFTSVFCFAQPLTDVEKHVGNKEIEGLKYINDKGHKFIKEYNKVAKTHWIAIEPDARSLVPKCVVPFKVSWAQDPFPMYESNRSYFSLKISCDKPYTSSKKIESWDVFMITNRPLVDSEKQIPLGDRQGTKEIEAIATTFLNNYNKENQTQWDTGAVFLGYARPKCAVPLVAEWKADQMNWGVNVVCKKSISYGKHPSEFWEIFLPTERNSVDLK